jgi:hypothetical protein
MKPTFTILLFLLLSCPIYSQITIIAQPFNGSSICQGSDPDQNTEFQLWLQQQTSNLETVGASSACGTITATPMYTPSDWIDTGCTFIVSIQWNVSDNCGSTPLVSTSVSYTISDTQAPQFMGVSGTTIATIECNGMGNQGDIESEIVAYINSLTAIDISDDCTETADLRNSIIIPSVESTPGICNETIIIDLIMTDNCGNIGVIPVNIIIEDTTPPNFPNINPNDPLFQAVECLSDAPSSYTINMSDGCGGTFDVDGIVNTSDVTCESQGTIHVEFPIEDACGNIHPDSPLVIDIPIQQEQGNELMFLNPIDNLPNDIVITISNLECQSLYSFPGMVWVENISDPNSMTWPAPTSFVEGVHYNDPCGSAEFAFTHTPVDLDLSNGNIIVTYTLDDGCGGNPLIHNFEISVNCTTCGGGAGLFCSECDTTIDQGCFTCDADELLNGFASCLPPYEGMIQGFPQPNPICITGVPNNMSWFSFIAGSSIIMVDIQPTECLPAPGGLIGIQAGIWDFCDGMCISGDIECLGNLSPKNFSFDSLIVGNTYHLFVDGCAGSECNYEIIIEGQEAFLLDNMQSVIVQSECYASQDNVYCAGQEVRFNVLHDGSSPTDNGIFNPPGSTYDPNLDLCFEWSIDPPIDGISVDIFSQLIEGGPTPVLTLPMVTESTEFEICILEVSGLCADPCDEAECVGNCCTTITVLPESACSDLDTCSITNIAVETSNCDADGVYTVNFDFDYNAPNCDGFTVSASGNDLGEFDYGDIRYSVGPFDSCGEITELTINDNVNNNCSTTITVPLANCCINSNCMITDLAAGPTPCDSDGFYFVDFTFNILNPGNNGFVARNNSTVFGELDYGQPSYRIGPFDSCDEIVDLFLIDNDDNTCTAFTEIEPADCCIISNQCNITNLFAETSNCNADSVYTVDFEFDVINPGSNGFTARGNGTVFGEFQYGDLFYTIGPFDSCDEINELVIIDNDNIDCSSAIAIEAPDCCSANIECSIEDLSILDYNIDTNGFLNVSYDFVEQGTANLGFDLFVNGEFFSFNEYMDIPYEVTIESFNIEEPLTLTVCENDDPDCCDSTTIELENTVSCILDEFSLIQTECMEGMFFYVLDFNIPLSQDSAEITIEGNGNEYGIFQLSDLPVTLGPFDINDTIDELLISVEGQVNCVVNLSLDPFCDILDSNDDLLIDEIDISIINRNIKVTTDLNVESEIYVYDIIGRLSYKGTFINTIDIPTDHYNSGIHVIHIRNSLGRLTHKIFIER